MTLDIEPVSGSPVELGEGPHWNAVACELTYVDILNGAVWGWRPRDDRRWKIRYPGEVSAALPRASGGRLVAIDHELRTYGADGMREVIGAAELDLNHTRFNDCRCDPAGRLWAGTMSRKRWPGTAALYRLVPGGQLEQVITGTTISNGLGWSPDGARMYFIDSLTQRVDVFDYDIRTGEAEGRRAFAHVAVEAGLPDGLTVDAEGCVWVALFGGGALRRYSPDGELEAHIQLPASHPTCPAFGGEDMQTLFVTTSRHRLNAAERAEQPLAGAVLALRPGATGLAGAMYAG